MHYINFSLGIRRTRFEPAIRERRYDTGSQATFTYIRRMENGRLETNLSKSLQPNSDGEIVDVESATISFLHRLSSTLDYRVSLNGQREETQARVDDNVEEFGEFSFSARKKLYENHTLMFSYRHAKEFDGPNAERNSPERRR